MAGFGNWVVGVASGFYGGGKGTAAGVRRAYREGDLRRSIIEVIKSPVVIAGWNLYVNSPLSSATNRMGGGGC